MGTIKELGATLEETPVHQQESDPIEVSADESDSGCSFSVASSF